MQRSVAAALLLMLGIAGALGARLGSQHPRHITSRRQLRQEIQPNFVPQGCQDLTVAATASFGYEGGSQPMVFGSVTLKNPNTFDMPITQVKVQLSSSSSTAPLFVSALCGGSSVPANPLPYQVGTLVCTFQVSLPSSGPGSSFSSWTAIQATATISLSNAQCSSPINNLPPPPPNPSMSGCHSVNIAVSGSYGYDRNQNPVVFGEVTLSNPSNSRTVNFNQVQVQLTSSSGSTISVTATCSSTSVPYSSDPSQLGSLTCLFQISLPASSSFSSYNRLVAQLSLGYGSSSPCPSPAYYLPQPHWQQPSSGSSSSSGDSCHMISMVPSAWQQQGHWVGGKVVVKINVNSFNLGGIRIKVVLSNSRQGSTQWTWASCPGGWYSQGSKAACSWTMPLPQGSNPSDWSGMQAIAYGGGGSHCSSGQMLQTGL